MLQATLPEIKLALSSKSRDLLSHVISECMQMRGRIVSASGCFVFSTISTCNIHPLRGKVSSLTLNENVIEKSRQETREIILLRKCYKTVHGFRTIKQT